MNSGRFDPGGRDSPGAAAAPTWTRGQGRNRAGAAGETGRRSRNRSWSRHLVPAGARVYNPGQPVHGSWKRDHRPCASSWSAPAGAKHALAWAIAASPLTEALYCAPGNPGHRGGGDLRRASRPTTWRVWPPSPSGRRIDLVVVGPEAPLVARAGRPEICAPSGIRAFGPTAAAAPAERAPSASPKEPVPPARHPHRGFRRVRRPGRGQRRMFGPGARRSWSKADGLAAGKGRGGCGDRRGGGDRDRRRPGRARGSATRARRSWSRPA